MLGNCNMKERSRGALTTAGMRQGRVAVGETCFQDLPTHGKMMEVGLKKVHVLFAGTLGRSG